MGFIRRLSIHRGRLAIWIAVAGLVMLAALLVQTSARAAGTIHYVDCAAGNDANDGASPTTAWRTTTRANQQVYGPGDQVLFKRGTVCSGEGFKPTGNGAVDNPVIVADFGTGNLPVIDGVGAHEPALLLLNVQNYTIRNLDLTQHGQTPQTIKDDGKDSDQNSDESMRAVVHILGLGPLGVQNCGEPCTARNIRLEGLKVHDGSWTGIYASGGYYQLDTNTHGFVDNLVISNVKSYNNHKAGVEVTCTYYKTPIYHATNIQVLNSYLHHNGGDGAMIGPADHVLIDGNEASYNGQLRDARLGLWTWDSHDSTIQFNNSHHNMTPEQGSGARDGGGFDCDLGSEDCMLQYNWSHDNQGEGYLLMTWPIGFGYSRGVSHNIQMRYNVGERDGQKLAGGITIFGGVDPVVIYNNTIYYVAARDASTVMFQGPGAPITSDVWGKSGLPVGYVYNNIFITDGTVHPNAVSNNAWNTTGKGTFTFDNNLWWRVEGGVRFEWGGTPITTWAGWQARGFDAHGLNANPQVTGPLGGGPSAYALQAGSPARDAGRAVTEALRGMGTHDDAGLTIPQNGLYDIGAFEYAGGGPGPTPTPTVPPTQTVMHVADITTTDAAGLPKSVFSARETLYYRVQVLDQNGAAVSGATVTTELRKPDGTLWVTLTATTGADGWALFSKTTQRNSAMGLYTIPVTNVTLAGAAYDPAGNVKSSTTFTVN